MSSSSSPERKNTTEIYFNGGTSRRIVDFITKEYPDIHVNYDPQGNLTLITLPVNSTEEDKQKIILSLKNIYPFEVRETY